MAGCQDAQHREFDIDLVRELAIALGELHANARKLLEIAMSSTIDPAKDHDGQTEPANDAPAAPVCKCGHAKNDHMAEGPFLHALCCRCECEGFQ